MVEERLDDEVVVRGEEHAAVLRRRQVVQHREHDRRPVVRARATACLSPPSLASTQLVDDQEGVFGAVGEDQRGLDQLHVERRLVRQDAVSAPHITQQPSLRADACEDAIHGRQTHEGGGHVAADLREDDGYSDLPKEGALAAHVGARDDLDQRYDEKRGEAQQDDPPREMSFAMKLPWLNVVRMQG